MRTFDYRHLPQGLFGGAVGDANVRLYEDRGKLELMKQLHADQLSALREQAHFDNVDASTRVEGLYVDAARVRALIDGAEAQDETEAQVTGYSHALRLVEAAAGADGAANAGDAPAANGLDLSTGSVLKLYEALFAHRNLGKKSRYRKKDFAYVPVDGHMQAMPVSPVNAFETPLVLGGALDSLSDAFSADACSPLILNAVFTVDFLCIRPFDEGNGRIARLFAELLLAKAGFDVFLYTSIDRMIEAAAMDYYDALNACVEGWDRNRNDYAPYARYWLEVVHAAYGKLFAQLETRTTGHGPGAKTARVRRFVEQAARPVAKREVLAAMPDISEATVENALGKLVKDGLAEKVGAGRATAYLWRA